MHAPQITVIALWALAGGLALAQHGQPKTGKHSFGTTVFGIAVNALILWWGGFFG